MSEHRKEPVSPAPLREIAPVVERNIAALVARRSEEERRRPAHDRMADAIARFTGSIPFVYLHLAVFGAWIVINLGWTPLPAFDETFVVLAMIASVEAIFLSTFVLITQNRQAKLADKRADLDLQISLLSEHEITRMIALLAAIGKKLEVEEADHPEIGPLTKDVAPEKVLERLDEGA